MVRRLIRAVVAFATAASLVGVHAASAQEVTGDPRVAAASDGAPPLRARGVIVKLTSDTAQRRKAVASAVDRALPSGVEVTTTVAGMDDISLVRVDETLAGDEATDVVQQVEARADVEWAVPNYLASAQGAPPVTTNDPYFPRQRNLWDTKIGSPNGGYSIKAPALWQLTQGKPSVVVAVLDTGSVPNHPDLRDRWVAGYDFVDDDEVCDAKGEHCSSAGTFVSAGDGDGLDPDATDPGDWVNAANAEACGMTQDDYTPSSWHGSHVAGIIAGTANNAYGITGVAPGVRVQPIRVIGHCGATLWDIALGMIWSSGLRVSDVFGSEYAGVRVNPTPAKIANLSLGADLPSAADRNAVCDFYGDVAALVRSRGTALVAASGNANRSANLSVPAACPGFLSVAASSATGHRAWYSNFGSTVDVTAPGGDSLVQPDASDTVWSSILDAAQSPNGRYTIAGYEGTSMAAPAVAGGMALLASMGHTSPASLDRAVRAAVSPYPARTKRYIGRTITLPGGRKIVTGDLNCVTSTCGTGLFDLARVVAPPRVGRAARDGSVLRAQSSGLYGPAARQTFSWWRGSMQVGSGTTYRLKRSDIGRRFTVRHAVTGPFTGLSTRRAFTVPKLTPRTTISIPSKVKKSKRVTMKVRISVSLVRPTGTIKVYDGRKRIAAKRLYAKNRGTVSIRLPKLRKGKHTIRVVYSGSSQAKGSTRSKVVRSR